MYIFNSKGFNGTTRRYFACANSRGTIWSAEKFFMCQKGRLFRELCIHQVDNIDCFFLVWLDALYRKI